MKLAIRGLVVGVAVTATAAALVVGGSAASAAPTPRSHSSVATKVATKVSTTAATKAAKPVAAAYVHHRTQRVCSTVRKAGRMACFAIRQTDTVQPKAFATSSGRTKAVVPNATPSGLTPANLRSAYALTATGSAAQTVAIVDAYDDTSAESDLGVYRSQYGLPACTTANGCFRKVNQNGAASPLPAANSGWAGEISLDVDMVSAICPNCNILLLEANTPTTANLGTAVNTAVSLGAKFVSNSYGGSESSSDPSYDTSYYRHAGVAITASTGDDGYGTEYPAASQYVTAVGGTSLTAASNARGWTESAWSGAGSGCSSYDAKPSWQSTIPGCTKRAEADVSAVADPNTGVAVYQTYGGSGWAVYGGTSASSPIIASTYALAGTPGTSDYPASYPWAHTGNLFDVTSGSNGSCSVAVLCTAGTGWDGPTGLGTPNGTAAFTAGTTGTTVTVANPGSQSATVGTAYSLTLSASGGTTYSWTATGLPAGLSIGASSGTISGTPTTAGTYSVTATATSGGSSGSTSFTITVAAAGGGGCATGQKLGNPGFETGSASPWTASSGVIDNSSGEAAHSGSWKAWLDGYGSSHTDTLSQSVTIPAGCSNSTLSFYLHIDTAETTTSTAYDKLTVTIGSTTLATYSNLNQASGYTLRSFNVGSFAGQTVTVKFNGVEDSSLQTSFVIDDTALNAG